MSVGARASIRSTGVYALAKAARQSYLVPEYRDVVSRGFDGIIRELVTVNASGLVSLNSIVSAPELGDKQSRSETLAYYYERAGDIERSKGRRPADSCR